MAKVVGNYELTKKLGRGSFADVFYGINKTSGKAYAIKAISKEKVIDPKNVKLQENLDMEISIMRDYKHENVVCLFENFHSSRFIYLVLELCAGGDLSKFIKKKGRLEEKLSQNFLNQLICGLEFLNSKNIIHRDIKPANIMLSEDSDNAILKLADFGFARQLSAAAMAQTQCGTPLYMAPEIFDNHDYDIKADIWSIGCVFYEMLVGNPPFEGVNAKDLSKNIKSKPLMIPSDITVSNNTMIILREVLAVNPNRRTNLEQLRTLMTQLMSERSVDMSSAKLSSSTLSSSPLAIPISATPITPSKNLESLSSSPVQQISDMRPASTSKIPVHSNLHANLQSVAGTPPQRPSVGGASPATITFALNMINTNPIQTITKASSKQSNLTNYLREDDQSLSPSNQRRFSYESSPVQNELQPGSAPGTSYLSRNNSDRYRQRSTSVDAVSAERIMAMNRSPSSLHHPVNTYLDAIGEDDFVMVEKNIPSLSGSYKQPELPMNYGSENRQYDGQSFLQSSKQSAKAQQESTLTPSMIQSFEYASIIIAKICSVGDKFAASGLLSDTQSKASNSPNLDNILHVTPRDRSFSVSDDSVERFATAASIYSFALAVLKDTLARVVEMNKSASQSAAKVLDKLRQDFSAIGHGLLVRSNECSKKIQSIMTSAASSVATTNLSMASLSEIPAPEPILYCLAMKLARDAWVESLLGNVAKATEAYSDAKLLIDCLHATTQDPDDRRLLWYYAQSIAHHLEVNEKTRNALQVG